jgi:hypothetical protein
MSNVVNLMPEDATADEVLEDSKGSFKDVLILGWDEEGVLNAKSTASLDLKEIVYMIEVFKAVIITAGHEIDD